MRYYLDTEFNGWGGEIISLALVSETGDDLYLAHPEFKPGSESFARPKPWVAENVIPVIESGAAPLWQPPSRWHHFIAAFLRNQKVHTIITDWPDDIKYFCELIVTDAGQMINIPGIEFEMHRVDAYPTDLPGAIQHNAFWDAMALRHKLRGSTSP